MTASEFIAKLFEKKCKKLSFEELYEVLISAISGVGKSHAADLKKAFEINIIRELAENKCMMIARFVAALTSLAKLLGTFSILRLNHRDI